MHAFYESVYDITIVILSICYCILYCYLDLVLSPLTLIVIFKHALLTICSFPIICYILASNYLGLKQSYRLQKI